MSASDPVAVLQRRFAEITAGRSCSYWLRDSVLSAIERDPVDAVRDAEILLEILQAHLICCMGADPAVTAALALVPRPGAA
jgi:hypothetical protein